MPGFDYSLGELALGEIGSDDSSYEITEADGSSFAVSIIETSSHIVLENEQFAEDIIVDDFDRPDEDLSADPNWEVTPGDYQISDKKLVRQTTGTANATWKAAKLGPDQKGSIKLENYDISSSSSIGIWVKRQSPNAEDGLLVVYHHSLGVVEAYIVEDGVYTSQGQVAASFVPGDQFAVAVIGTTLYAYQNDVEIASWDVSEYSSINKGGYVAIRTTIASADTISLVEFGASGPDFFCSGLALAFSQTSSLGVSVIEYEQIARSLSETSGLIIVFGQWNGVSLGKGSADNNSIETFGGSYSVTLTECSTGGVSQIAASATEIAFAGHSISGFIETSEHGASLSLSWATPYVTVVLTTEGYLFGLAAQEAVLLPLVIGAGQSISLATQELSTQIDIMGLATEVSLGLTQAIGSNIATADTIAMALSLRLKRYIDPDIVRGIVYVRTSILGDVFTRSSIYNEVFTRSSVRGTSSTRTSQNKSQEL